MYLNKNKGTHRSMVYSLKKKGPLTKSCNVKILREKRD